MEDDFLRIETDVPGFGGYFLDADGNAHVFVTDTAVAPRARAAVAAALATRVALRSKSATPTVSVERGDYAFSQLVAWQQGLLQAARSARAADIVSLDADELRNRVSVVVSSDEGRARLTQLAEAWEVPAAALNVEVARGKFELNAKVTDRIRPLGAGLKMEFRPGAVTQGCTMGFLVHQDGVRYYLTASHCTSSYLGSSGTEYRQNTWSAATNRVGVEAIDPAWFTTGCATGATYCRATDAALIRIDDNVTSQKRVAETQVWGSGNGVGNLTIQNWWPVSIGGSALVGQTVYKTGYVTGTTYGPVTATCVDIVVGAQNVTCSWVFQARSDLGDSGAPIYSLSWKEYGIAAGILWGGYTPSSGGSYQIYYSDWAQIESELGPLIPY